MIYFFMGLKDQMYEVLSFHEYKSPFEIKDELRELRTKRKSVSKHKINIFLIWKPTLIIFS